MASDREKLKIIYMGTPAFAVPPLLALIEDNDFEVLSVVTQLDKKIGRKRELTPPPIKKIAQEYDIPVLQPPSIKNNKAFHDLLVSLKPDFIIVVAYGQILPKEILEIPKISCINIHGSLLPMYRGASPIEEALLHGDKETGISFIKMIEKLDAGGIYQLQRINIADEDTSTTLRFKLSHLAATTLPLLLKDITDGILTPLPQNEDLATNCHKISKTNGAADLTVDTAEEIKNRVRAFTPWPGCYLTIDGKKLKLLEVETSKGKESAALVTFMDNKVMLKTKKGLLIPLKVQLEGKNPMTIQDFLRGNKELFNKLLARAK